MAEMDVEKQSEKESQEEIERKNCLACPVYAVTGLLGTALTLFFTFIVLMPIMQIGEGQLDNHWVACTASGVQGIQMTTNMPKSLRHVVLIQEQHTIELVYGQFISNLGFAMVAHGLMMMAIFGHDIPWFAEESSSAEKIAAIITFSLLIVAYIVMLVLVFASVPVGGKALSGEGDGLFTPDNMPDFGLGYRNGDFDLSVEVNCYSENTWYKDSFESGLKTAWAIALGILEICTLLPMIIHLIVMRPKQMCIKQTPTEKQEQVEVEKSVHDNNACCFFAVTVVLMTIMLILFNFLAMLPVLQITRGSYDRHFWACAGSGVAGVEDPAPDSAYEENGVACEPALGNSCGDTENFYVPMDEDIRRVVYRQEWHQAEIMVAEFGVHSSFGFLAYALGVLGAFGSDLKTLADANTLQKVAALVNFVVMIIVFVIIAVIYNSLGNHVKLPEWEPSTDLFFAEDKSCDSQNPWFADFEERVIILANVLLSVLAVATIIPTVIYVIAFNPRVFEVKSTGRQKTKKSTY